MAKKKGTSSKKVARGKPTPAQEAKSENTSAKRLAQLAEESAALARLVARNPSAPSDLMQWLGSHSDPTVRKWVASHPETPPEILVKLATQFPEQLLINPILDILLLENPNLLNELPVATRRSLLKRENCPASFLEWLAQDRDEGVQLALAMNPNTPSHVLKRLQKSKSKRVANAAQQHVNFPASGRSLKPVSNDDFGKELALERLPEPEEKAAARMLPWLACVGDHKDRPPVEALRNWAREQMEALPRASSPYSDVATLSFLARSNRDDVRLAVAKNRSAPGSVLWRLAADPKKEVRTAVAQRADVPAHILQGLAGDKLAIVRTAIAANPTVPQDILVNLATDKEVIVRVQVAGNLATPVAILESLAKDKSLDVRCEIAAHPDTPGSVLNQLATDKNEYVRAIVALNPATGPDTLARLAKDGHKGNVYWQSKRLHSLSSLRVRDREIFGVRLQVASNPSTPANVLADLIDEAENIRWTAATNKNARMRDTVRAARIAIKRDHWGNDAYEQALARHSTAFAEEEKYSGCKDPDVLQVLAKSIFPNYRTLVAENPSAPSDALKILAEDKDYHVARAVGENASATPEALHVLAKRTESSLRELAASHASSTPDLLRQLSNDKKPVVRLAVAANQSTPPDVLERLSSDRIMLNEHGTTERDYFGREPLISLAVADNISSPPEALRKLAVDRDSSVRYSVATNPAAPESVLTILKADDDEEISGKAIRRLRSRRAAPRRDSGTGAKKTASRPKLHALRNRDAILAGLPGVAHLVVEEYAHDDRVRVRRRLASNPLLPKKYAVLLAKDAVDSVRKELAENPGVSDTVLALLADDTEKAVAKVAKAQLRKRDRLSRPSPRSASSPRRYSRPKVPIRRPLPPPKKADLSRLGDWQYLAALPSAEISRVIRLEEIPKRKRVVLRKELAEAFINKYSRSNRPNFKRLLCLLLPECPIPVLARAVRSTDWKERLAVASHPNTPPAIRKQLANDGNAFVRAAAREVEAKEG